MILIFQLLKLFQNIKLISLIHQFNKLITRHGILESCDSFIDIQLKYNPSIINSKTVDFIKICSNCFSIYNFLQSYLEKAERRKLFPKTNEWIHREKRFANTFNESLKMLPLTNNQESEILKMKTLNSCFWTSRNSDREKKDVLSNNYSFLNKQDYTSQILNMGFSTSFKSASPFLKDFGKIGSLEKMEKEKTMTFLNLYETSNSTTRKKICKCFYVKLNDSYFYILSYNNIFLI